MWLHSLKVAQLLRIAACLHTNQSRSYLNHLVYWKWAVFTVCAVCIQPILHVAVCHITSEFCDIKDKYILHLYREIFLNFFLLYQNIFFQVGIVMSTCLGKITVCCADVIVSLRRVTAASSLTRPYGVLSIIYKTSPF